MKTNFLFAGVVGALTLGAAAQASAKVVLTFEGLGNSQPIGNYYNGGGGGNLGISFGADSLALRSAITPGCGGTGIFSGQPSGCTVAFFLTGPGDVMNVAAGFTTGFSFFYADQVNHTGSVSVFSGLDGTGTLLANLTLPSTPNPYTVFVPIGVTFLGTAESVVFSGSANYIAFDDVTLGSASPGVPEPATWTMMLLGFAGVGFGLRRRTKAAIAA